MGFSVSIRPGESVDSLIKRFMRKTKKEKIVEEIRERQHYEKPSVRKRKEYYKRLNVLRKLRDKEKNDFLKDK